MKESIEEKAKAYDKAIERAKNFIENGDERERTIAESIFAGIMEANELMIGDWVLDGNVYAQVTSITCDGNIETTHNEYSNIELIEPTPLTKEILEKNGFVANKHVYPYPYYEYEVKEIKVKVGFAFPQGNRTSYKEPWVYIDSERVFVEHLPCVFVHQLQHALRLCGIDKTIEL